MFHFFTFKKGLLSLFALVKLNMVSPPYAAGTGYSMDMPCFYKFTPN